LASRNSVIRTAFALHSDATGRVEVITGACHAWRFRPHFHAGDEIVRILAGRARLQLPDDCREVSAGDTLLVPAGTVHRFEPVDRTGWAFVSRFVPAPERCMRPSDPAAALTARAKALLLERHGLRTRVAVIARACSVSAGHLSRTFRHETGSSLHNFHVLLALHQAKAFLRAGMPAVEAALAAGFYDQAHLNREFVRTFGMTPVAFRNGWADAA